MTDFTQSSSLSPQSSIAEGDWVHVHSHQAIGKVIEKVSLWPSVPTWMRHWAPEELV